MSPCLAGYNYKFSLRPMLTLLTQNWKAYKVTSKFKET